MRCHRSGTACGNACTLPAGSIVGFVVAAKTTPEVPREAVITPGSRAPVPTAVAAWSPPPATTGVPAIRPVASAASCVTVPVTSVPSKVGGIHAAGMPSASSISDDHVRAA